MQKLSIRKILSKDVLEVANDIRGGSYLVVFDDGEIELTSGEIILTSFALEVYRGYLEVPVLKEHAITNYYRKDHHVCLPDSHVNAMTSACFHIADYLDWTGDSEKIYALMRTNTIANNNLYNYSTVNHLRYMRSVPIREYYRLKNNPKLRALKQEMMSQEVTISRVSEYNALAENLIVSDLKNPDGSTNLVSWLATRKLIKGAQVVQVVFTRGYVPELTGENIDHPITNCFLEGMGTVRDFSILSRESALAINATMSDLATTTIEARRLSYIAMANDKIIHGDCGSTEYIWYTCKDSGMDLKALYGAYYLNEDTKKVEMITKNHQHLKGKTIQIRTQFGCKIGKPTECCSTCFGLLSETIPPNVNAGADVSKNVTHDLTQSLMALKHLLASLASKSKVEDPNYHKYFKDVGIGCHLKKIVAPKICITIDPDQARNLSLVNTVENVSAIAITAVTHISHFELSLMRPFKPISVKINATVGKNPIMLSYNALQYIKDNPDVVERSPSEIRIDITNFDNKEPLFIRPAKMSDLRSKSAMITSKFERSGTDKDSVSRYGITGTVVDIMELTDYKLNIGAVQAVLAGYLCEEGTSYVTKGLEGSYHASVNQLLFDRSLALQLIYRFQNKTLTRARYVTGEPRMDSILDASIDPRGYLSANGYVLDKETGLPVKKDSVK